MEPATPSQPIRTIKPRRSYAVAFTLTLIVWLATLVAWGIDRTRVWMDGHYYPIRHKRMLLEDVDHDVLRAQCRQLLATAVKKSASTQPATQSSHDDIFISQPPPAIQLLKPEFVRVLPAEGLVIITFAGGFSGFDHWSLRYYDDATKGRGTTNLGGGVWFERENDADRARD
jgi:hypothetical protein